MKHSPLKAGITLATLALVTACSQKQAEPPTPPPEPAVTMTPVETAKPVTPAGTTTSMPAMTPSHNAGVAALQGAGVIPKPAMTPLPSDEITTASAPKTTMTPVPQ